MLQWFMIPNALKCEQIQHYYKAIPTQNHVSFMLTAVKHITQGCDITV